jgi:hypothetical protein
MSLSSCRFTVVLIVVLLVGTTLRAAQQTATIGGLVSDQTGVPLAAARVELVSGVVATRSAGTDARLLYPGAPLSAYTGVRFSF